MKRIAVSAAIFLFATGTFLFATSMTNQPSVCAETEDCVCCPCTPDCQPGDPNCVCPEECQD